MGWLTDYSDSLQDPTLEDLSYQSPSYTDIPYQDVEEEYVPEYVGERGFWGDIASRGARGAMDLVGLWRSGTKAVFGGDFDAREWEEANRREFDILKPDVSEFYGQEGFVSKHLKNVAQAITPSVGGAGTGALVGAGLGSVVPVVGTAVGAGIGALSGLLFTFGAGTGQQAYDAARDEGLSEAEAKNFAFKMGAIEGGTEMFAGGLDLLLAGTPRVATSFIKQGAKNVAKNILRTTPEELGKAATERLVKDAAKKALAARPGATMAGIMATEMATEGLQNELGAWTETEYGMRAEGLTAKERAGAMITAAGMSMLFGAVGAGYKTSDRSRLRSMLESDDLAQQKVATDFISKNIGDTELQGAWDSYVKSKHDNDLPIRLNDAFVNAGEKIEAAHQAVASPAAAAQQPSTLKGVGIQEQERAEREAILAGGGSLDQAVRSSLAEPGTADAPLSAANAGIDQKVAAHRDRMNQEWEASTRRKRAAAQQRQPLAAEQQQREQDLEARLAGIRERTAQAIADRRLAGAQAAQNQAMAERQLAAPRAAAAAQQPLFDSEPVAAPAQTAQQQAFAARQLAGPRAAAAKAATQQAELARTQAEQQALEARLAGIRERTAQAIADRRLAGARAAQNQAMAERQLAGPRAAAAAQQPLFDSEPVAAPAQTAQQQAFAARQLVAPRAAAAKAATQQAELARTQAEQQALEDGLSARQAVIAGERAAQLAARVTARATIPAEQARLRAEQQAAAAADRTRTFRYGPVEEAEAQVLALEQEAQEAAAQRRQQVIAEATQAEQDSETARAVLTELQRGPTEPVAAPDDSFTGERTPEAATPARQEALAELQPEIDEVLGAVAVKDQEVEQRLQAIEAEWAERGYDLANEVNPYNVPSHYQELKRYRTKLFAISNRMDELTSRLADPPTKHKHNSVEELTAQINKWIGLSKEDLLVEEFKRYQTEPVEPGTSGQEYISPINQQTYYDAEPATVMVEGRPHEVMLGIKRSDNNIDRHWIATVADGTYQTHHTGNTRQEALDNLQELLAQHAEQTNFISRTDFTRDELTALLDRQGSKAKLRQIAEKQGIKGHGTRQFKALIEDILQAQATPPAAPAAGPARGEVGGKLASGETVLTVSGRETTPFPKLDFDSERKTQNTLKRVDKWLVENAIAEAQARGDEFNLLQFQNYNLKNLSPADKDGAELYLFGETMPEVLPPITRPLVPVETPTASTTPTTPGPDTALDDFTTAPREKKVTHAKMLPAGTAMPLPEGWVGTDAFMLREGVVPKALVSRYTKADKSGRVAVPESTMDSLQARASNPTAQLQYVGEGLSKDSDWPQAIFVDEAGTPISLNADRAHYLMQHIPGVEFHSTGKGDHTQPVALVVDGEPVGVIMGISPAKENNYTKVDWQAVVGEPAAAPEPVEAEEVTAGLEPEEQAYQDYEFFSPGKVVQAQTAGNFISQEAADARFDSWIEAAQSEEKGPNSGKTILSLFDATGTWSTPWIEAGYNVIQIDQEHGVDVNDITIEWLADHGIDDVHGVLAACPCTDFASSGARWWKDKDAAGKTAESVELVNQVQRIVEFFRPAFWALENPVGRIAELTGLPEPHLVFQPHHYGDPYTKKTNLWGKFNADLPTANVEPTEGSKAHRLRGDDPAQKKERSTTPSGFAYAFFMANSEQQQQAQAETSGSAPQAAAGEPGPVAALTTPEAQQQWIDDFSEAVEFGTPLPDFPSNLQAMRRQFIEQKNLLEPEVFQQGMALLTGELRKRHAGTAATAPVVEEQAQLRAQVEEQNRQIEQNVTLDSLLDKVIDQGTAAEQEIAQLIKNKVSPERRAKVKVRGDVAAPGAYYSGGDIFLNDEDVSTGTSLHEMLHAFTVDALENDQGIARNFDELRGKLLGSMRRQGRFTAEQALALEQLRTSEQWQNFEAENPGYFGEDRAIAYSLINNKEFLAQALADPVVKAELQATQLPQSKQTNFVKSLWHKVVNLISRSSKLPATKQTLLDEVLQQAEGVLGAEARAARQAERAYELLPAAPAGGQTGLNYDSEAAKAADQQGTVAQEGVEKLKDKAGQLKQFARDIGRSVSDLVKEKSDKIYARLMTFEINKNLKDREYEQAVEPWVKAFKRLSRVDRIKLSLALFNGDAAVRDQIHQENNMTELFNDGVQQVLDEINSRSKEAGLLYKERANYFPRLVKDIDGLVDYIIQNKLGIEKGGILEYQLEQAKRKWAKEYPGVPFPESEQRRVIGEVLRRNDFFAVNTLTRASKDRSIQQVNADLYKFYTDAADSLISHIYDANEKIGKREFIGMSPLAGIDRQLAQVQTRLEAGGLTEQEVKRLEARKEQLQLERDKAESPEAEEEALAGIVLEEMGGKGTEEQREMVDLLVSRMAQKTPHGIVDTFRNITYAATMGNYMSAMTQLSDIPLAMLGSWSQARQVPKGLLQALAAVGKRAMADISATAHSVTGGKLGKEEQQVVDAFFEHGNFLAQLREFSEGSSWSSKALNTIFTASGLRYADLVGKETRMRASFEKWKKADPEHFVEHWKLFFGEEKARQVHEKFQGPADVAKTDPGVLTVVLTELSDYQPITPSQQSKYYLKGGNWRLLWVLKTFHLRALSAAWREGTLEWQKGGIKNKANAVKKFAAVAGLLALSGAGNDELKDWILGRDVEFSENVTDNLLGLLLINKYALDKGVQMDRPLTSIVNNLMPPLRHIDNLATDVSTMTGLSGEPFEFKTLSHIPVFGRHAAAWTPATRERAKKRSRKSILERIRENAEQGRPPYQGIREDLRTFNIGADKPILPRQVREHYKRYRRAAARAA